MSLEIEQTVTEKQDEYKKYVQNPIEENYQRYKERLTKRMGQMCKYMKSLNNSR